MARLPSVLGTADLSLAELCAARIDGELMSIDEAWAPVDEPDLPSLRATALAMRAPRLLVIERHSAAWVHGAIPAPPPLAQFCVSRAARVAAFSAPQLVVREVVIDDADIVEYPGARCTSVGRTGFDLLREPPAHGAPHGADRDSADREADRDAGLQRIVTALCSMHPGLAAELRVRFADAVRLPHRALALDRLSRVERALAADERGSGRQPWCGPAPQPSLTR
ncbi:hypothetical protein ACWGST_01395 [Agromyces sp. NPDC055520]